jgi:hypothetical protein
MEFCPDVYLHHAGRCYIIYSTEFSILTKNGTAYTLGIAVAFYENGAILQAL